MSETRTPLSRRSLLRGALFTAAAVPFGVTLAACDTGSVGGAGGGGGEEPADLDDKRVGAMDDYGVGTTFVATEPLTFDLLYRDHPNYALKEDWSFFTHIEETNNVTFNFTSVPLSDFEDRRSLLIAAGDAPTIITQAYVGTLNQFVPSGALLPISRYVEHMPNFLAKTEAWGMQAELDYYRQEDGEYYVLPGLLETAKPGYTIAIRDDLWQAAGFDADPATFDELRDQLRTVREQNPDLDYVYSDRWSSGGPMEATLNAAAPNFGVRAGWGFGDGTIWNGTAYEFTGALEGYRQLLEYFHSLIDEGLLDPESLTQDDDAAIQKLTSGRSAAIGSNDQEILAYRSNLADAGNTDAVMRQIIVPAGPAGNIINSPRFESGLAFSSGAADQDNFVALLQFVDWLYYSDEGLEFAKWGVEGETFTRGADGARELLPDIDINGLNPGAPKMLNTDFGYHNGVFMPAHGSTQDLIDSMLRDEVVEFLAKMNEKEPLDLGPGYLLNELDQEQAALQQTALKDATYQATAAFLLGQRSFDDWDAFQGELEAAGLSNYLQKINDNIREA
ncbi:extracellular solute-binding protein [Pseudactinotalea sp.]|uniref:ABC transporter substrate-binding protein n=1 Tax=Pseudactinotalea sp. TaxID=1926260 RepID=UPI003B3A4AC2